MSNYFSTFSNPCKIRFLRLPPKKTVIYSQNLNFNFLSFLERNFFNELELSDRLVEARIGDIDNLLYEFYTYIPWTLLSLPLRIIF